MTAAIIRQMEVTLGPLGPRPYTPLAPLPGPALGLPGPCLGPPSPAGLPPKQQRDRNPGSEGQKPRVRGSEAQCTSWVPLLQCFRGWNCFLVGWSFVLAGWSLFRAGWSFLLVGWSREMFGVRWAVLGLRFTKVRMHSVHPVSPS